MADDINFEFVPQARIMASSSLEGVTTMVSLPLISLVSSQVCYILPKGIEGVGHKIILQSFHLIIGGVASTKRKKRVLVRNSDLF